MVRFGCNRCASWFQCHHHISNANTNTTSISCRWRSRASLRRCVAANGKI